MNLFIFSCCIFLKIWRFIFFFKEFVVSFKNGQVLLTRTIFGRKSLSFFFFFHNSIVEYQLFEGVVTYF